MKRPKAELLSKAEFAERMLVDERTISRWADEGMPVRDISGRKRYHWPDCLKWHRNQIRTDERATRHAGGDEEKKSTLADAKVRRAIAEAGQAEIALAKARGETLPVTYVREEFQRIASRIRTKLVQLPTGWASRLGACLTFTDRRLVLLEAVNELMPELRVLAGDEPVPQIAESELPTSEVA